MPVLVGLLTFIVRPLQRRQAHQREESGRLIGLGADTVAGLRVLRGIGGEQTFLRRYAGQSQEVRRVGYHVAGVQAALDAAQVLLPGIFVLVVTWLGARYALRGEISVGELVAFYGYSAFLVLPLRTATEFVDRFTRAHIGARKIIRILAVRPDHRDHPDASRLAPEPPPAVPLVDERSGVVIEPGVLTAVVSARPEDSAALADRLGRFGPDAAGVRLGGTTLLDLPLETVRRRVVVSETDPRLFTGTLREELDPWGRHDDAAILDTLAVASGEDVLEALADGLDSEVEERGRSFSGGQRQRLALTRALLTDAETLVLVEPTSAVDAHTEARVAGRLAAARRGRTTAVMTASPLAARPRRPGAVPHRRRGRRARHPPRAHAHPAGLPGRRRARGGLMAFLMTPPTRTTLPVAEMPTVRTYTADLMRRHRRQLSLVIGLHALAAVAALVAPRVVGLLVDTVTQHGLLETVDRLAVLLAASVVVQTGAHLVRAAGGVPDGRGHLRRAARAVHGPRRLAAPVDGRAGRHRRPRLAHDQRRRGALARRPVRHPVDLRRRRHRRHHGGRRAGDRVAGRAAHLRRRADPVVLDAVVPALRPRRLPARARHLRRDERRRHRDRRRRAHRRRAAARRSAQGPDRPGARATPSTRRSTPCGCACGGSPRSRSPTSCPSPSRSLWGGFLVAAGQASVGTVTAVALYVQALAMPLDELLMWLDEIQVGATSLARVIGIADVPPDRTATGEKPRDGRLEVDDVRYAYRSGRDVLKGVSLDLRPGERLAIVGPSGAGKSTLGRLMAGIDGPRTGRVDVGGVRLVDLELDRLRGEVALVTQEHHVFVGTLADNLLLARPDASRETLREALAAVDALPWALGAARGARHAGSAAGATP